jgi:Mn2+/Fe2+ NRAMP family transporter
MSTSKTSALRQPGQNAEPQDPSPPRDPYILSKDKIQEPPTRLLARLKFLGPGMITSAAVVGSGELIATTALGAQAGFILLWLVLVSTFLKVWVQIELGRWAISTGKVAVTGYDDVPPRLGKRGWMSWLVLLPGWCCSCSSNS